MNIGFLYLDTFICITLEVLYIQELLTHFLVTCYIKRVTSSPTDGKSVSHVCKFFLAWHITQHYSFKHVSLV